MSRKKCYTSDYTNSKDKRMEHAKVRRLIKSKTKMITMRINPDFLNLLDETLKKDKEFDTRNELIETLLLRYLEEKKAFK